MEKREKDERLNQPAVGLIATSDNEDETIRAVLNARERDHAVFVACGEDEELRSVQFAERFGAEIIESSSEAANEELLRQLLATAAKVRDLPGLLYYRSMDTPLNYEKSLQAFENQSSFVVPAATNASTENDTSNQEASVMVAIPAYNESSTIQVVIEETQKYADEVLVIDDGSTDGTVETARAAGASVVQHHHNMGYGAALKTAFTEARKQEIDHLVTLDGDGQHDPADVPRLIRTQLQTGARIVIGSRFAVEAETRIPTYRRLGLWFVNMLMNASLGVVRSDSRISDTQSGFRAYDSTAIRTLSNDKRLGDDMSISIEILYHANRHDYRIEEVGTTIDYSVSDSSNHNPFAHGYVLVRTILNAIGRKRPLVSVALPGFVMAYIGFGVGYWGFMTSLDGNYFPTNRAAISIFLILLGLCTCFSGLVLHSLNSYFVEFPPRK